MEPGDVILIDSPFTVPTESKVRPAIIVTETIDKFRDLVVCAISSVMPATVGSREILLRKDDEDFSLTGLRVDSVIKIDRIATLRRHDVIVTLGSCTPALWDQVRNKFRALTD